MRPLCLTVEGFTSFRQLTVVDFEGADYFALVGPTGSGKSSLVDALAFALYGSVSRYDNRNLVAPVISQGRVEARVGLDFAIGANVYRAVRVVRAATRGRGATTKEARLELLDRFGVDAEVIETLAGDADGVTAAVTDLLGLNFEHFTKCVVLPQGAFARFLHDQPAARQDLLVELLNLGVYGQLGQRANQEGAAAANRAALASDQLAGPRLAEATPAAVAQAAARVVELDGLRQRIAGDEPVLADLTRGQAEASAAAASARSRVAVLGALRVPGDVAGLAADLAQATAGVVAAEAEAETAPGGVAEAETALAALPARALLEAAGRDHTEREEVRARIEKARRVMAERAATELEAGHRLQLAQAALVSSRQDREVAGHAQLAATLATTLVAGQPCPVCQQPVPAGISAPPAPDLAAADRAVQAAEVEVGGWTEERRAAGMMLAKGEEKLAALEEQRVGLDRRLADHPDHPKVALAEVGAAEVALSAARQRDEAARSRLRQAGRRRDEAAAAVVSAWAGFDQARDSVGAMGPPAAAREDLAAAWNALSEWAAARQPLEEAATASADNEAQAAACARDALLQAATAACRAAGIETLGPLGEVVAEARAGAIAAVARLEEAVAEAERLHIEVAGATEQAQVARALAGHLKSSGFEKWMLEEVLEQLVAGATDLLSELSGGTYSLALEAGGGFAVIDHRHADALRSARTLSGGETFLASLALALALADRLAGFGTAGASLEAIFLDEGFGTLDPDTLDTVSAAIENLAAGGRVVGIVTHVRDLADRVPVRFEVEKGPTTSTVRRVEG